MPTSHDHSQQKSENQSTYVISSKQQKAEILRLTEQDHIVTRGMGGVLAEQTDPTAFQHILDVACGPGSWIIETAQMYPTTSLVGIDISQRMIEYARSQAEARHLTNRVEFHVMDVLHPLALPDASFDLVNLRLGISFIRTWDWPNLLSELLRITRPGGIIRITDSEIITQSNSPSLTRLQEMGVCAFFRAGHLFAQESTGLVAHLRHLFTQYGIQHIQEKAHPLKFQAGTAEGQAYCEDMWRIYQSISPFLQKWGCYDHEYDAIYQQARREMQQPDFHVTWNLLTVWGRKPDGDSLKLPKRLIDIIPVNRCVDPNEDFIITSF